MIRKLEGRENTLIGLPLFIDTVHLQCLFWAMQFASCFFFNCQLKKIHT